MSPIFLKVLQMQRFLDKKQTEKSGYGSSQKIFAKLSFKLLVAHLQYRIRLLLDEKIYLFPDMNVTPKGE